MQSELLFIALVEEYKMYKQTETNIKGARKCQAPKRYENLTHQSGSLGLWSSMSALVFPACRQDLASSIMPL